MKNDGNTLECQDREGKIPERILLKIDFVKDLMNNNDEVIKNHSMIYMIFY